jgi:hypothetical protein
VETKGDPRFRLLGKIANPQEGIHHRVEVSADGRIAVAYIGLEEYKPPFLWLEGVQIHKNDRLRAWDLASGEVLATTPFFNTLERAGSAFRVSPDGKLIVTHSRGASMSILRLKKATKAVTH